MVKDGERCQMEGTFLSCHGDGVARPFTWRGARLCRICMRVAMVESDSLFSAMASINGLVVPQWFADEYLNQWKSEDA